MRIPSYWARGKFSGPDAVGNPATFTAYAWSFTSMEEAKQKANEKAQLIYEKIVQGKRPGWYEYLNVPLREEILDRLTVEGVDEALITRNRYGAMVLNTKRVCFVDIDIPYEKGGGIVQSIMGIFSGSKAKLTQEDRVLARIRQWSEKNPAHTFITYRTYAGFRLLLTDKLYDVGSDEVRRILKELGSDKLYQLLCLKQECFRARLTPKPWRIGCIDPIKLFPPYPQPDAESQSKYKQWVTDYEATSANYHVCKKVEQHNPAAQNPLIETIVALHDKYACTGNGTLA